MPWATLLAVIAGFVLVNALFVAAEFALVSAPRPAIAHRAASGDSLARRILAVLRSPGAQDRYIATSQLGITIASVGLGMYGEHSLAAWLAPHVDLPGVLHTLVAHGLTGIVAVAALTYVHIVAGEMVPKSLALQRAEGVVRLVYWPMRVVLIVTYPLVATLHVLARAALLLFGIRRQSAPQAHSYSAEELELIVEESARGGALRKESGALLKELFGFGDLNAGQAMVPRVRVVGIPVGASSDDLRALLTTHRHTRFPVYDGDLDHIIGMLHVKDLLRRLPQTGRITAADVRPIPVVPETSPLDDVLTTMERTHAHLAVVIDEHGGTAGVISLEDLLEEVVGDIDEGVPEAPPLQAAPDGSAIAAGTVRLDELGQHFRVDLEHEDVDSVSGLVLARLGRPPVVGDVVDYGRIRFEVTAVSGHGVRTVRASLLPETD
ncbi:MAG TPA: hemolysin family protein [Vicinamibacterales bacterium]|nr:hemolysin family protein [Vicinamibacterales bacterium]